MAIDFTEVSQQAWIVLLTYFPLGAVGLWRWSVWLIKKSYAATYRPMRGDFTGTVAVVTPVYNEDPEIFRRAITSWRYNNVEEIIAVIDYTDTTCIGIFQEFAKGFSGAKLVVTEKPGKRPALVDGIKEASSEFVALVDSDTIWGEQVKRRALIPFKNPKVGGVATRQSVLKPTALAQRLFNAQLNLRYLEEMPFMVALGGTVVTCLSGRTAFYRRSAVMPLLDQLLHETFWGKPVISGDDKRLTYLVEAAGWQAAFQQNAEVFTPGMLSLKSFMKQRLRWTRNSWRADLRTLTQRWVWRHPRFVLYLIDRTLQPFAQLLSPLFFVVSLILQLWIPAAVLFAWWMIGRTIRMWPYLRRNPREVALVPVFVLFNFYAALMKVYALVTLNRQGWITRWDSNRLPGAPALLRLTSSYVTTGIVLLALATGVLLHERAVLASLAGPVVPPQLLPLVSPAPVRAPEPVFTGGQVIERYVVQRGDTIASLARRWNVPVAEIIKTNAVRLPSINYFEAGLVLDRPSPHHTTVTADFDSKYGALGPLRITYVEQTSTIEVRGRGRQITPYDIAQEVSPEQLRELRPGEWYLQANLNIKAGVTLQLLHPEVAWLKLKSDASGRVAITSESGALILDRVKITSWDASANAVDTNYDDGRSYLVAKGNSRLDILYSELAYLGEAARVDGPTGAYGVAWHLSDEERDTSIVTGEVQGSRFHHNYDGAYVSGGVGMRWEKNDFYENVRYGLDLYGHTHDAIVASNTAHHNGVHGMILSTHTTANEIRGNRIHDNGHHGLILHEQSHRNLVTENEIFNQRDGIVLHRSHESVITNNTVHHNNQGVRLAASQNNLLRANTIHTNNARGMYLDATSAQNGVWGNTTRANRVGLYVVAFDNEVADNTIEANEIGVYLAPPAQGNSLARNRLINNSAYGLYVKTAATNYSGENSLEKNAIDIAGS